MPYLLPENFGPSFSPKPSKSKLTLDIPIVSELLFLLLAVVVFKGEGVCLFVFSIQKKKGSSS